MSSDGDGALRREFFNVSMGDVDAAGILFFGTPLIWLDRLMGEWMREIGLPISALLVRGEGAPAVHSEVDYHSPLSLDEPVEGILFGDGHGRSSYKLRAEFRHRETGLLGVEVGFTAVWTTHELVDGQVAMSSTPLPDRFLAAF